MSIFAWSILSASKLKTIRVKEGTQAGENILNLLEAFDFEGNIQRHFKLQKGDEIVQVSHGTELTLIDSLLKALIHKLSGFQNFNNATFLFQKWLVSRLFANIFYHLNFSE